MPRFFVTRSQVAGDEIVIRGNDVNHIKNVLRMHPGDELSISDGQGTDYFCRIKTMEREEIGLSIENSWNSYVELPVHLYLFQGLPKSDKMELIIQKAVELGVYEIIPVRTSRVIVKLDEKKEEKTLEEAFSELDVLAGRLEDRETSLEDSFRLYKQGMELLKYCNDKLDTVEKKMLQMNEDGSLGEFSR